VAVLPLGTGNDLARCLGWGGGIAGFKQRGLPAVLRDVEFSPVALLDRWAASFARLPGHEVEERLARAGLSAEDVSGGTPGGGTPGGAAGERGAGPGSPAGGSPREGSRGSPARPARRRSREEPPPPRGESLREALASRLGRPPRRAAPAPGPAGDRELLFNNYIGIGIDAKVALDFHRMREVHPNWFQSQVGNKVWYGTLGATDLLARACWHVPRSVELEVDGEEVCLPGDLEGIVVLNIASHMGGVDLWASAVQGGAAAGAGAGATPRASYGQLPPLSAPAPRWLPQHLDDGVIEIVGIRSAVHMGQIQVGLSRAVPVAQGREVVVRTLADLPVQVDGEPWLMPPSVVRVTYAGVSRVLRRPRSGPAASVAEAVSEVLLAAEGFDVISGDQRRELATAISVRIAPLI